MSELHAYQRDGVRFLAERPRALLADDPGAGKSVQTLKAAAQIGASRLLFLCPSIGTVSWPQQITRWQDNPAPTIVWNKLTNALGLPRGSLNLIVTYDQLVHHRDTLLFSLKRSDAFDCAIIDECHYLKSRTALRTKAVYGGRLDITAKSSLLSFLRPDAPVWILSGTPWPNNFSEFYTHANALFPDLVESLFHSPRVSFGQWLVVLCDTHDAGFGTKVTGTKRTAVPAIRHALSTVMLRRRKKDVLADLKDPQHFDTPIEQQVPAGWDAEILDRLTHAGWDGSDETLLGALRLLSATEASVSTQRLQLGQTKAPGAARYIAEHLNNAEASHKVLVFAHHTDVIASLARDLGGHNPAVITGKTSSGDKLRQADKFQTDPACRVFIGQTMAAGTSITLTAGSAVFMVEPDWVPSVNEQAISRAHRQGQTREVFVYWLSAPGTLDHTITNVIRRKTRDLAMTMGDE